VSDTSWRSSARRAALRNRLSDVDGVDPDDVIRPAGGELPGTVTILHGRLAPEGALVKSTAISPSLLDAAGVYRAVGRARVSTSEDAAIAAVKGRTIVPGEVLVLSGVGPSFVPETFQITSALKYSDEGGLIPRVTDGRFSGVSTGPCIGHVSPEAAAGGPLGRLRDGDPIEIEIDTAELTGRLDCTAELGTDRRTPASSPRSTGSPMTPACGPLSRRPAAAAGTAASTTRSRSAPVSPRTP
jgi:dihydroxyacid dehydratase/phosphogluconate dehydratase